MLVTVADPRPRSQLGKCVGTLTGNSSCPIASITRLRVLPMSHADLQKHLFTWLFWRLLRSQALDISRSTLICHSASASLEI